MKLLLRICIGLFLLLFAAGLFVFFYLRWNRPQYDGELHLQGLQQTVTTRFDANGIPHIYGANEHDVFLALGYLHAQDRLFQMELLRRVGSGRLAPSSVTRSMFSRLPLCAKAFAKKARTSAPISGLLISSRVLA